LITGYDPVAMGNASRDNPELRLVESAYELADGADALVVCTEWNEFKQVDFVRIKESMKQPIIVDGRNIYEPDMMQELGFIYRGVGRGSTFTNGHEFAHNGN
jgi:UDPglucose 6-dehydrogenase